MSYDINAQFDSGEFSHAALPWTSISQIEATVRCVDGRITNADIRGEFDGARGELHFSGLTLPQAGMPFDLENAATAIRGKVEHLPLTRKLFAALPANMHDLEETYQPSGRMNVTYDFRRDQNGVIHKNWIFVPEKLSGTCKYFPYHVEGVTGIIERELIGSNPAIVRIDVSALASGRLITIKGRVLGDKGHDGIDLEIRGDNVPIDDRLIAALPEHPQTIAKQFHAQGQVDIEADIHRLAGVEPNFKNHFVIRPHDAEVNYDLVRYHLTGVSASLEIYPDRHWECHEFSGRHGPGFIQLTGYSTPSLADRDAKLTAHATPDQAPELMRFAIRGCNIPLDEEFETGLAPPEIQSRQSLKNTFKILHPTGKMDFTSQIVYRGPTDVDVTASVVGASLRPKFFDYSLDRVSGTIRYAHNQVLLSDVRAQHRGVLLGLRSGNIVLQPGGGYQAYIRNDSERPLIFQGLTPDDELFQALPIKLRKTLETLQLQGPLNIATSLIVTVPDAGAEPEIWWDGVAWLTENGACAGIDLTGIKGRVACTGLCKNQQIDQLSGNLLLDHFTVLGQPLNALHTQFEVSPKSPEILRFRNLEAELFGGTVGGEAHLNIGPVFSYEVLLKAMSLQLEPLGKHNKFGPDVEVQGAISGGLYLRGDGTGMSGLRGSGQIEVPNGKLYRLPLLLSLLQAFGLRMPADRTAFEQARAKFTIDGPEVQISELELIGNAISLNGQGTLNVDGTNMNLDFTATWGRLRQMLPPVLNEIPGFLSGQLLKIKMRGKIGDIHFEKDLVPAVSEPVRRVFGGT